MQNNPDSPEIETSKTNKRRIDDSEKTTPQANDSDSNPRLNKFLAERLGISRREADDLIESDLVSINGERAQLGNRVGKDDVVIYNNKTIPYDVEYAYYAYHKPVGYVCSRNRQSKDMTIYDILPNEFRNFKNVGRLDKMSSGIILLTNDGDFAFQMTHPKFFKQKIYEVTVHKPLTEADLKKITEEGVEIGDGLSKFDVVYNPDPPLSDIPKSQRKTIHLGPDGMHLIVTLTEGRNRQIRRTFSALGYNVLTLHRVKFGDYELGNLKPGEYREIQK